MSQDKNSDIVLRDNEAMLKSIRIRVALSFVFLALFLIDAYMVTHGQTLYIDNKVRLFAYSTRNAVTEAIFIPLTYTANKYFITGAVALLLIIPKTRKEYGLPIGVSSLLALIPYKLLKTAFARPRPDSVFWLVHEHGFSFPSGHSMNGLIFYAMLIFLIRKSNMNQKAKNIITVLLVALIIVIGWSRLFCGVHYCSDVIGGWCIGLCWVMLASSAYNVIARR